MMGRGTDSKEERLRKRLATQQRERDITQKLFSNRVGGVGAEYLRTRTANTETPKASQDETSGGTPSTPKLPSSSASALNLSSFGKAQNVRLSPMKRARDKPHGSGVKKTRFITAKGIREAGRDSLGGQSEAGQASNPFSDSEDDLDII
jgi:minichromosome maintenance protein 10